MMQADPVSEDRLNALTKKIHAADGHLPVIDRHEQPAQWAAWRQWRKDNNQPVNFMDRQERFTVLTEWPPADLAALELRYVGGRKTSL